MSDNVRISRFPASQPPVEALLRAYWQSKEGVLITDSENQIVAANAAFCSLSGYEEFELIGQSPRMLASGHASPEFFQGMWSALSSHGFWEGEIWNRRKDGSTYPRWLKIAALHDDAGQEIGRA